MLPADTAMGAVTLTARDAGSLATFYERVIGLERLGRDGDTIRLGAGGRDHDPRTLVRLVDAPDAPATRGVTGLFHLALLLPDRVELGHAIRRVVDGGWRLSGASDHFVSEALYLRDPEGNGIEIYRDRPRADWTWRGDEIEMGTVALDLQSVYDEAAAEPDARRRVAPETVMGHVHLSVADLAGAETFYRDVVGFDLMARYADQASFVSAGGYHHHLGMNVWGGPGLAAPPPGVAGLRSFEILVPDPAARDEIAARAREAGALAAASKAPDPSSDTAIVLHDPAGLASVVG